MIDTDKYEGHTPAPWKWFAERPLEVALIGDLNSCADTEGGSWFILDQSSWGENPNQDAQLIADAPLLLEEVKRLRKQYTELREALVGDSPNWTHEELIEQALELSKPAELEFGEWHTDEGDE